MLVIFQFVLLYYWFVILQCFSNINIFITPEFYIRKVFNAPFFCEEILVQRAFVWASYVKYADIYIKMRASFRIDIRSCIYSYTWIQKRTYIDIFISTDVVVELRMLLPNLLIRGQLPSILVPGWPSLVSGVSTQNEKIHCRNIILTSCIYHSKIGAQNIRYLITNKILEFRSFTVRMLSNDNVFFMFILCRLINNLHKHYICHRSYFYLTVSNFMNKIIIIFMRSKMNFSRLQYRKVMVLEENYKLEQWLN